MLETFKIICKLCFVVAIFMRIFNITVQEEPGCNSKIENVFAVAFIVMVALGIVFFFQDL